MTIFQHGNFNFLVIKEVPRLNVSFSNIVSKEKINPNFIMLPSCWSKFKFGLIFYLLTTPTRNELLCQLFGGPFNSNDNRLDYH